MIDSTNIDKKKEIIKLYLDNVNISDEKIYKILKINKKNKALAGYINDCKKLIKVVRDMLEEDNEINYKIICKELQYNEIITKNDEKKCLISSIIKDFPFAELKYNFKKEKKENKIERISTALEKIKNKKN